MCPLELAPSQYMYPLPGYLCLPPLYPLCPELRLKRAEKPQDERAALNKAVGVFIVKYFLINRQNHWIGTAH